MTRLLYYSQNCESVKLSLLELRIIACSIDFLRPRNTLIMTKIVVAIVIGLALLGGAWWFVSSRLLAEPAPPRHPTTQVVQGVPLDAELENDPLPPVTTQSVRPLGGRGSNDLPKVAAPTKSENAGYTIVQFDSLADFPYQQWWLSPEANPTPPPEQLPAAVRALNGKASGIAGFINPLDLDDKGTMSNFMLMRTQSLCCYGAPLTLQDWIDVKLPEGQRVRPTMHVPVFVMGKLEVGEIIEHGFAKSLYRLQADKVLAPGEVP